ncbi:peptidoglycan DD-metalloendopeptidase family protein [Afifella sp. H1R]|uniref:murein hydrolase activator EnvC family protein n=1 Tax=Afifella sp. H1R TaxID=2908841 RepID=UPI001F3905D0|nr:peptidoglycan DD-metalloendopeptidase family protein [Afifella sp. H1R]
MSLQKAWRKALIDWHRETVTNHSPTYRARILRNGIRAAVLVCAGLPLAFGPSFATETELPDEAAVADEGVTEGGMSLSAEARRRARAAELEAVRRSIEVSKKRQEALRREIETVEADRAKLSSELIATAQRLRRAENSIQETEVRLDRLQANEDGVRQSLEARREVLGEVLAALQRMGGTPPPPILSRPEDALKAIRGSILAGAVLPDIRVEAEALAADLAELTQLKARIEEEHEDLKKQYATLGEEQTRINLLIESKKEQRQRTEAALTDEQKKAAALAEDASGLEDLIGSLEKEVEAAARAAEEARRAEEAARNKTPEEAARDLQDTARMAPAVEFDKARGILPLPAAGPILTHFGERDEFGAHAGGISIATRPDARVVSPADGWVVYAGPFRSYGQVLILNVGSGYHVVLAGLEHIDVALGQFVLAGEPVAVMGAERLASLSDIDHTSAQPVLYVEFRKDGRSIDPDPWWDRREQKEVRG